MQEIEDYLLSRKWQKNSRGEYSKDGSLWRDSDFRLLGKSRQSSLGDIFSSWNECFSSYKLLAPLNITEPKDTLFVSAGVQKVLPLNNLPPSRIAQPCLRFHSVEKVGKPGISSSFVNICTEQVGASLTDHLSHIENWFDFFSSQGLYVGNFSLKFDPNWKAGEVAGHSLLLYYGSLQIGDAVYIPSKRISDVGIGLERLAWAIKKDENYFDVFSPFYELRRNGLRATDAIRSSTLCLSQGVLPGNCGAPYRVKQLLKIYLEHSDDLSPKSLTQNSLEYWKMFSPTRSFDIEQILHSLKIQSLASELSFAGDVSGYTKFDDFLQFMHRNNRSAIQIYLNKIGLHDIC